MQANEVIATVINATESLLFRGVPFISPGWVNAQEAPYSAVPGGVVDATSGIQAAITAAIAADKPLFIPPGTYKISSTLNIVPASGSQQRLDILADRVKLVWHGAPSIPIINYRGGKNCRIFGLHVDVQNTVGAIVWDIQTVTAQPSTSGVVWEGCQINFGTGGDCVGWRGSYENDDFGDISAVQWRNCFVRGVSRDNDDIAWQALRPNNLVWTIIGGGVVNVATVFSNRNALPGATLHGGGSHSFINLSTTNTKLDYDLNGGGLYNILGGRYETGLRFLNAVDGPASFMSATRLSGVNIATYSPADGIVFRQGTGGGITLDDCIISRFSGSDFTSALFTLASGGFGNLLIRGGGIQADLPVSTVSSGDWGIVIQNVARLSAASGTTGRLTSP